MAKYQDELILKDGVSKTLEKINKSTEKLNKSFAKMEKLKKISSSLKDFGNKLTVGVTLPIIATGSAMVKLASDMEETLNKVDVSFGKSSSIVKEWAKSSISNMGLAQQTALDTASLFGSIATGMGIAEEQATKMAMVLTQRGADIMSFYNVRNEVAQTALKSIFTGEAESLKNLGITMTEATLQSYAYSKGIRKKIKDMTEIEKVMLRYDFVLKRTSMSEGDFVKTGGGASNQMRMFQEQMKELGVLFGQVILPVFTKFITKINGVLKALTQMSPFARKVVLIFAGVLAIIGPLTVAIGSLIGAITAIHGALLLLAGNPVALTIMAIVAGIVALVAVVALAIKGIKKLVGWFKKLKNAKESANVDMGTPEIASGVGNKISNSNSYRSSSTTNNNTNTTNNFYGNILNPTGGYLNDIMGTGGMMPAFGG